MKTKFTNKFIFLVICIFLLVFSFSCNIKVKVNKSKGEENKEVKVDLGLGELKLGVDVKDNDVKVNMNGFGLDVKKNGKVKLNLAGFKLNVDSGDVDINFNGKSLVNVKNGVNLNSFKTSKSSKVEGSGIKKKEIRVFKEFTSLNLDGAYAVFVKIGKKQKVVLEADDNIIPMIETKMINKGLVISLDESISAENTVKIFIIVPSLNKVNIAGSMFAEISGINNKGFKLNLAGSAAVEILGKTDKLKINLAGSGVIDSRKLKARVTYVNIAGSGLVDLFSSKELIAKITGSGNVTYLGNPKKINKKVVGSGSITRNN